MKVIYFLVILYLTCISQVSHSATADNNYCEALKYSLLFYKAQRAGRLPDNDIPWRGNSVLDDTYNGKVDSNGDGILSKGYFDAGDGVKFGFPMAYTITMLSWIYNEYQTNINNCGLDSLFKETIKWGSDYTIAAHVEDNVFVGQIADANIDHSYWIPPEKITDTYARTVYTIDSSNPGTDLAMEASASLTATYLVFKTSNTTYANECLSHAKTLYSFAMNSDKKLYSDSITQAAGFYTSSGYEDEIAWASAWLYKATGDSSYLETANTYYSVNAVQYNNNLSWDSKGVAVGMLLYQINGGPNYKTNVETALKYWQKGGGITYTPNGLAYLSQWGPNRYSMSMALIAAMYGGDYLSFAESQLNYVLGNNANSYSFVVGYGSSYPKNPHHRAAHHSLTDEINNPTTNTYILYGALVGGPASDDSYKDDRTDYTQSEVALDYNVGLVGTLAALSSDSEPASSTNPYGGNEISTDSSNTIETDSSNVESTETSTEPNTASSTESKTASSTESNTASSTESNTASSTETSIETNSNEKPNIVNPTTSTESSTTTPTEPSTTKPTEPSTTTPTEPSTTKPTEPSTTKPTDSSATKPTDSSATKPTDSSATTSTDSSATTSTDSSTVTSTDSSTATSTDSSSSKTGSSNSGSSFSDSESSSTKSDSSAAHSESKSSNDTNGSETSENSSNSNSDNSNLSNESQNNDSSINPANTNNESDSGNGSTSIHKISSILSISLLIIYASL